jgi:hypothetical protein
MNVSSITRSHPPQRLHQLFSSIKPDIVHDVPVVPNRFVSRIPADPVMAGARFHRLTLRMADDNRLSPDESSMIPWLSVARRELRGLGVQSMEIESTLLNDRRRVPAGVCDLFVTGGPKGEKHEGIVEFKVRCGSLNGGPSQREPRAQEVGQLASYLALADDGDGSDLWGAIVLLDLSTPAVRIRGYSSGHLLVKSARKMIADAYARN